jgi:hypothetical protein
MEFTRETAQKFVIDFLVKNGFTLNHDGRLFKDKCIVTIEDTYYKVSHYDEDFLEWMDWFSSDLTIVSLAGYLSWYDFIERGYIK